jgi:solute carrier family 8 (sodium/calcium exchanger)
MTAPAHVHHVAAGAAAAAQVICSATRLAKRKCPVTGQALQVRVPVWNWVVANVSLMAVGSSAPEILLAVVESVLRLGKTAGELGPSTIVGSAAYNLLMISAVCTMALPAGEEAQPGGLQYCCQWQ